MNVKLYVEGGGQTSFLRRKCRQGFSEFLRKAGLEGHMPRIVASGSRERTFEDFHTALGKASAGDFIVLLVDSESAVPEGVEPWMHLKTQDGWDRPANAGESNAHLMVQCMEAWFLADKETLAAFFGSGFRLSALPARIDVENVSKTDALEGLSNATRLCAGKGEYGKGRHSFDILELLDPVKVMAVAPHTQQLVNTLTEKAKG